MAYASSTMHRVISLISCFFTAYIPTGHVNPYVTPPLPSEISPCLMDNPALFQQINRHLRSGHPACPVERHIQKLPKPGRVIIDTRPRVPECFHHGVHGEDLLLEVSVGCLTEVDQLAQKVVGGFGFPGAAFARDDDTLVLPVCEGNGSGVGREKYGSDITVPVRRERWILCYKGASYEIQFETHGNEFSWRNKDQKRIFSSFWSREPQNGQFCNRTLAYYSQSIRTCLRTLFNAGTACSTKRLCIVNVRQFLGYKWLSYLLKDTYICINDLMHV